MTNANQTDDAVALSGHITIGIVLIALTGLNVVIYSMDLEPEQSSRLVLFVAAIQVFLILEFLMHLINGEKIIVTLLFFTMIFVAGLFFLSYSTFHDTYGEHLEAAGGSVVHVSEEAH